MPAIFDLLTYLDSDPVNLLVLVQQLSVHVQRHVPQVGQHTAHLKGLSWQCFGFRSARIRVFFRPITLIR